MDAKTEALIRDAIEDAILEGAHEWDAYAIPATDAPVAKAMVRIREALRAHPEAGRDGDG